ncbi:helix-turn-helix transcriptional regulator [Mangrovicoccus sp. HB161399]|uniref:ArsR/SmtB family transcription factor n=1 Tax=Mangrovicoccus sp. HB161399 TaxID=2720392 RepID=UPI00155309FA|nr:metalloregulator ArsR/SmtB family transcription factor [Mangrovicoccus sp. HB161399]
MSDAIAAGFGGFAQPRGDGRDAAADAPAAPPELAAIVASVEEAVTFLKALGHEGRLLILCHLAGGEKSVTQLETLLSSRQAAVSQQLARLRMEGLVQARRDGQQIYYSLLDEKVLAVASLLDTLFGGTDGAAGDGAGAV